MKDSLPEYVSGVDFRCVRAGKIRLIELEPRSGRMLIKFTDKRFPPLIHNSSEIVIPCPGHWAVMDDSGIEFKSDLEFLAEFRIID